MLCDDKGDNDRNAKKVEGMVQIKTASVCKCVSRGLFNITYICLCLLCIWVNIVSSMYDTMQCCDTVQAS